MQRRLLLRTAITSPLATGLGGAKPSMATARTTPDPGLRENGKLLVKTLGCAAFHGDRLNGHDFPRLAGRGSDYLLIQLSAFSEGTRSESMGTMKSLTAAISPDDRKAIANYLASHVAGKTS